MEEGSLDEVGRNYILQILQQTGWRVEGPKGAARILGLNPSTLRSRMLKLGIRRPIAVKGRGARLTNTMTCGRNIEQEIKMTRLKRSLKMIAVIVAVQGMVACSLMDSKEKRQWQPTTITDMKSVAGKWQGLLVRNPRNPRGRLGDFRHR